jgi:vacuolar-type H+-ATPase subunit I/STV1
MALMTTAAAVVATTFAQGLSAGSDEELRASFTAGVALVAVGVLFSALRRVAQVVAALAAAAAAVGSVFLLVVVLLGLFAAALILGVPM